ncbi:hypothetical protein C427_4201 [Paraglaciecola psychrophila 170]|uniref:Uncharacterized protein n=1 Tax=Paraglaciecola psychrophila 170 TaxID=1129794 RepID=M4RRV7_9ALTE|nr:hypothetical protein C427_4201 [Paraglaciecola psychrophila 170]
MFEKFVELEKFDRLSVLIISIVLATLTYRFVEIPFKKVKFTPTSYKSTLISLSVTLGIALTTWAIPIFNRLTLLSKPNYMIRIWVMTTHIDNTVAFK